MYLVKEPQNPESPGSWNRSGLVIANHSSLLLSVQTLCPCSRRSCFCRSFCPHISFLIKDKAWLYPLYKYKYIYICYIYIYMREFFFWHSLVHRASSLLCFQLRTPRHWKPSVQRLSQDFLERSGLHILDMMQNEDVPRVERCKFCVAIVQWFCNVWPLVMIIVWWWL